MQLLFQTVVFISFFIISQTAFAEEAHVHGVVRLTLAVEGHELLLELESPAANLLGFEHKPKTAKQQAVAKQLLNNLKHPENMWQLKGAACTLSSVDIDSDLLMADKEVADKHHDEKHHDHHDKQHKHHNDKKHHHKEKKHHHHDEEHKHHDEHKHHSHHHGDHENDHDGHEHAEHNDINVSYVYHCKSLQKLTGFKTQLFSQYQAIEKIDLQWLIAHNKRKPQGAATLTQQKSAITF